MHNVDELSCCRVAAYEAHTHGDRSDALEQLGSVVSATTAEMLDLITAADRQEDWRADGATSMAGWLVAMLRVSQTTAREWVRVGQSLDRLPELRDAFASGMLSWDQVRPATHFVEPPMDELCARELPGLTVTQIEEMARSHKARTKAQACRAKDERRITWREDHEAGGCGYSGFLPADEAAIVNAALTRRAEAMGPDPQTEVWDPFGVRCADSLVELAQQDLVDEPGPDPTVVVVHADADVIDGVVEGNGSIDGMAISRDSVLRLLCDGKVEYNLEGPDGTCVGIGRASRVPPRWLRRRIVRRDGGCRFPGYNRRIRQVHHIDHWVAGGSTDSWNLASRKNDPFRLCDAFRSYRRPGGGRWRGCELSEWRCRCRSARGTPHGGLAIAPRTEVSRVSRLHEEPPPAVLR